MPYSAQLQPCTSSLEHPWPHVGGARTRETGTYCLSTAQSGSLGFARHVDGLFGLKVGDLSLKARRAHTSGKKTTRDNGATTQIKRTLYHHKVI